MTNNSPAVLALTRLFAERAPKRAIIRGSIGDGQGNVLSPRLDDFCFVRLHDNDSTVVNARNLTVPMMNDLAVDVERTYAHSKAQYNIIGLTQSLQYSTGTQPIVNVSLHGNTHAPGGYDPIDGGIWSVTLVAANYSALPTDRFIGVTSTAAPRTITLPDATIVEEGTVITVKDMSNNAATNNITILPIASQELNDAGPGVGWIMIYNLESLTMIAANGAWWILANKT